MMEFRCGARAATPGKNPLISKNKFGPDGNGRQNCREPEASLSRCTSGRSDFAKSAITGDGSEGYGLP